METTQAMEAVLKRAASDAEFRKLALSDGAAALREVGGTTQDGQTVTFSETETDGATMLPPMMQSGELSDDSLDQVAGGASSTYYCGQGATSHVSKC